MGLLLSIDDRWRAHLGFEVTFIELVFFVAENETAYRNDNGYKSNGI